MRAYSAAEKIGGGLQRGNALPRKRKKTKARKRKKEIEREPEIWWASMRNSSASPYPPTVREPDDREMHLQLKMGMILEYGKTVCVVLKLDLKC